MKRLVSPLFLVLICSVLSLGLTSSPPYSETLVWPISMTLDANRLYVSDRVSGLHVYDVTDLTAPEKVIRIPLHSNVSSAVKGDIVYTNDAGQLQAIRIADGSYTVVARIGNPYPPYYEGPVDGGSGFGCACTEDNFDPVPKSSPGSSSSYATFALIGDNLYRVDGRHLNVYDITNREKPKEVSSADVGWDIETLQGTTNFLFIGGTRGMYIFDRSDPRHPRMLSQFQHARACDPVVVNGSTAFVTLRGTSGCGTAQDELLCVSIKDPRQPKLIGEMPMSTPWGLAVENSRLYVSHGDLGYTLLDVSTPSEPAELATWTGEDARDFIWAGRTLYVMGHDNVTIYDITDPLNPALLSKVEPVGMP